MVYTENYSKIDYWDIEKNWSIILNVSGLMKFMNSIKDKNPNTKQLGIYLYLPLCAYLDGDTTMLPPTFETQDRPFISI